MPLTKRQERVVICPYRYKKKEVWEVMLILGDPEMPPPFGERTWYNMLQLRAAAQSMNIPQPENFKRRMNSLDKRINEYPTKIPLRRAEYKLPPNT